MPSIVSPIRTSMGFITIKGLFVLSKIDINHEEENYFKTNEEKGTKA